MKIDISSKFLGISMEPKQIRDEIHARGWKVKKVHLKKNKYEAVASNPYGKEVKKLGQNEATALANVLMTILRMEHTKSSAQHMVGMWRTAETWQDPPGFVRLPNPAEERWPSEGYQDSPSMEEAWQDLPNPGPAFLRWTTTFTDQIQEIAEAYAKAPVYDPKAVVAFKELADDSVRRFQVLSQQLDIEVVDDPEPYANVQEMCEDVHEKRKFKVSRANSEHPVWSVDENVAFRTVHDVLGHCVAGGDFGWNGENLACAAHFPLLSPTAQQALFTECIAQTAYGAYYRDFGPQKVALFPQFFGEAQHAENAVDHRQHPIDQSYAPLSTPAIEESQPVGLDRENLVAPHQAEDIGWPTDLYDFKNGMPIWVEKFGKRSAEGEKFIDPNANWSSGIEPAEQNAYVHHGNPLDWGKEGGPADMAETLQRDWYSGNESVAKQAIVNAFRVAILSPMKNLRWNSIHYQHLDAVPYDVTDPSVYHDTLNEQRVNWNVSKFGPEGAEIHIPYAKEQKDFVALQVYKHPDMDPKEVEVLARQEVENILHNFEQVLTEREEGKDPEKQRTADQISAEAAAKVKTFLKNMTKPRNLNFDEPEHEQLGLIAAYSEGIPQAEIEMPEDHEIPTTVKPKVPQVGEGQVSLMGEEPRPAELGDQELYGGWLISQMRNIASISRHIDSIYDAAMDDIASGGKGHEFRSHVLSLNLPGVGPKVASFAWLLLMPTTSELATIDTHMIQMLGGKQSDLSNRDYFMYERILRGMVDRMGYGSMPLGQAQWSLWDAKRTGIGSHQDHSALAVSNPTPHDQIEWAKKDPTDQFDWSKDIEYMQDENGNAVLDDRHRPQQIEGPPEWWESARDVAEQIQAEWMAQQAKEFDKNSIPYVTAAFKSGNIFPTFPQAWKKFKPIKNVSTQYKPLAAYAVIGRYPKKKLETFLDTHRKDFPGPDESWTAFKKNLREEINKLQSPPGWKGSGVRPHFLDQNGQIVEGEEGESIMKHLRKSLGLTPQDIWNLELEVGKQETSEV